MIDVDNSGTLTKAEIVEAVQSNETVITFLRTCGEPNLQFLLQPRRLQKALDGVKPPKRQDTKDRSRGIRTTSGRGSERGSTRACRL